MRKTLLFVALALVFQGIVAKSAKNGKYELCSDCGYYHYEEALCEDAAEALDGSSFNANGARKLKFSEFENIDAQNGIYLTIINGDEDFILANAVPSIKGRIYCKNRKTTLLLRSRYSQRATSEDMDTSICHILVSRSSKTPLNKVKLSFGSKLFLPNDLDYKELTIEALSGSEADIDTDIKVLKCIAKVKSEINVNADCDSISVLSETKSKVNIEGNVANMGCVASYAGEVEFDVDAKKVYLQSFNASLIEGKGKCANLSAEASEASECVLTELDAKRVYGYAFKMSDIHVNTTNKLNMIAESMSMVHIYDGESKVVSTNEYSIDK